MGLFGSKKTGKNAKENKKENPLNVPKTAQDSIPYQGVYENGIIQINENLFSKMYVIPDINFTIENTDKQKEIFGNFMELLSSFGPEVHIQQVIYNKSIKPAELEKKVLMKSQNDKLNEYREEMNEMLIDKLSKVRNNIIHEKYFVVSVEADDIVAAKASFSRLDDEISKGFKRVTQIEAQPVSLIKRLSVLYEIYNIDSNVPFYRRVRMKGDSAMESFNMRHIQKMGLTSKDVIGPTALTFERDHMIVGNTYARALMIVDLPTFLRGDILTELANMPFNMLVSVHYRALPQNKSIKLLKNKLIDVNANVVTLQKKASKNGYSVDVISPEIKQASQEVENLMGDLTQDNQKLFYTTVTAVIFAKDKEQLDENTKLFQSTAERFVCQARILATQQEAGLSTCMPLGVNKLKTERLLNTRAAAIFLPFSVKELWQDDGMYYGLNGISKQMILYNRTHAKNGNGCIFGVPGSGKSFSAKREIVNVLLNTDDEVFVIDPENEYAGLAKMFYGSSIRIAPGSGVHINPMDMSLDYSPEDGDDPIVMKSDFIASICEAATGTRYPLTPIQKSVIDRCVKNVYKDYMDTLRAEGKSKDEAIVPTLFDLYKEIDMQPEPEAHNLALALEKFVKGTQNSFAFRTNVNVNNRFTIYNIKDIGEGMKAIGLQVCLDNIWNKMIDNYKKGKRTWLYCDEFHLLAQTEVSAKYTQQIWRRARKWNGIPTGITQQVEDMMKTEDGRAIIGNSEFVMMLSMNACEMTSSIAGVLDNILATLLVSIYNFLYKPDGMIDIFSQYNDIINNILEKKNFISNVFDVLKLVGIALLVTSFLVSLMDKTSAGDFSINNFFRHLLKYFILYILLINANTILTDLLDITTGTFDALKTSTDEITANSAAVEFNHVFLANSVHKYMGFGARLGMFIMLIVPYAISVLFTIILNFFAISRMIEMTVRVSVAPVVAGLSFFGNGADMDFVRFVKRTLGLFFQIIVILIICASITFVHNALVVTDENAHKSVNTVVDPAVKLKGSYTADYPEIEIRNMQTTKKQSVAEDKKIEYTSVETSREWKKAEKRTVKKEVTDNDHEDDDENGGTSEAYAKDDFKYFVNHIVDPSTFFISTGIMLSALFLIFRSREISTKLFA